MSAKSPNFFIIGAPKCGTTSLASWLAEHPNVYIPPVKEPHYFNTDLAYINTPSERQYRRLFNSVTEKHSAIGEASVFYLYSENAVEEIERRIPNSRYVVLVRNPVEMAPSLHDQQVFSGNEHITDFERAWLISDDRLLGKSAVRHCREPRLLAYQSVCRLGEQVARLYTQVPKERVLALVLDDLKADPRREYHKVLEFLGVPDDGRRQFPVANRAKERRWPAMRRVIVAVNEARGSIGIPRLGSGVMPWLDRLNLVERPRAELSSDLRKELREYFRDDVELLSALLGRELCSWLTARSSFQSMRTDQEPWRAAEK